MDKRCGQIIPQLVILAILILGAFLFGQYSLGGQTPAYLPVVIALLFLVFLISLTNTDFALVILIFSMLLSPELALGGIKGRAVVIRLDDILLFIVFFGWLTRMAIHKELGLLRVSPLNRPIAAYIFICLVSSLVGVLNGTNNPKYSIFYLLKYTEYFVVFFMVSNNIRDTNQIKRFVFFMLFTCFIVSIYALFVHFTWGGRATAPFEGEKGEANTLAGYLLLMMSMGLGCFLYVGSIRLRVVLAGLLALSFVAFLYTLSRSGWLAFFPLYLTFIILAKKYRTILILILLAGVLLIPPIMPHIVQHRVENTFAGRRSVTFMGKQITLDESAQARVHSAIHSIDMWKEHPFIGSGVPGGGVVSDVQYTRVLREVGTIGFIIFIWMVFNLFKVGIISYRYWPVDSWERGLTIGFIAALTGLLVMGIGAEVFIIIRIMEPFWFLTAIVAVLPEIDAPTMSGSQGEDLGLV